MVVIEPLDNDDQNVVRQVSSNRSSSLTESQAGGNGSFTKVPKDEEDDLQTTTCGIGSWRPEWLQMFANTKFFLLNICLIGIVQSMAGSLQFTVMNTLEKRFAFDSKISGNFLLINFSKTPVE